MTIQINYKSNSLKKVSSNLILFVDDKFNISGLKKHISSYEFLYISDLLKTIDILKHNKNIEYNNLSHDDKSNTVCRRLDSYHTMRG